MATSLIAERCELDRLIMRANSRYTRAELLPSSSTSTGDALNHDSDSGPALDLAGIKRLISLSGPVTGSPVAAGPCKSRRAAGERRDAHRREHKQVVFILHRSSV
ncbi:hypothetical protein EVAR_89852_1 [Eumeta japonica]|uniref:Uncharacterized protein n=1 Tax=Eumeta variegata TaxID=151549 RepID=A0A4C1ZSJ4_EUMVA|nr:hypothetical protein EVAR_89852_1 [Eumeta japonica]